jgi:hypothetical protein
MSASDVEPWSEVMALARTARGPRPSARWLNEARERVRAVGDARFAELAAAWLALLDLPPREGRRAHRALSEGNATLLQGLAWCCGTLDEDGLTRALGAAALACLEKVPGVGARSHRVGNACIWALGSIASLAAVCQLQRLRARVTYGGARRLIDAALEGAAERSGMGRDDLDDLAVPTFGLEGGACASTSGAVPPRCGSTAPLGLACAGTRSTAPRGRASRPR